MTVYLDDEPITATGDTLAALLADVRPALEKRGRIIVEVRRDGTVLVGAALDEAQGQALADAEVRLYSAEPAALARQTLGQVRQELATLAQGQQEAAVLLQRDEARPALEKLATTLRSWQRVQQAVMQAALCTGVSLDDLAVDGRTLAAVLDELVAQLRSLRDRLEAHDMVGIADALAYEWPATITTWGRIADALDEQIAK